MRFLSRLFNKKAQSHAVAQAEDAMPMPPHVLLTPRALRIFRQQGAKHAGENFCVFIFRVSLEEFSILFAPSGNLAGKAVRAVCPQAPAYIEREAIPNSAVVVVDHTLPRTTARGTVAGGTDFMPAPYPDNFPSDPGRVRLSFEKLGRFHPELLGDSPPADVLTQITIMAHHLLFGDTRAAIVAATKPHLVVSAYSDDLDCITLLRFPSELVAEYRLTAGQHLVTVNTYRGGENIAPDLVVGPRNSGIFENFNPFIADFLTDDLQRLDEIRAAITPEEWQHTLELTQAVLRTRPIRIRDGRPLHAMDPAPAPRPR